jgi:hypothetical protein
VDVVTGFQAMGQRRVRWTWRRGCEPDRVRSLCGDLAGFSLDTARLNEDEVDDILIGAFWAAGPGDARPMAGEVYALHGAIDRAGTMDLATMSADVTVYGAAGSDRLGEGVAAGDVNGDGLDDLVLPAPFAVNLTGVKDAGRTYVIQSPRRPASTWNRSCRRRPSTASTKATSWGTSLSPGTRTATARPRFS